MAGKQAQPTGPSDLLEKPSGKEVVLHTRVVTAAGGGPDKTILLSASYLADTNYWLAAAYMHPPDDPGFATIQARAAAVHCPLVGIPDRGPLDRSVLRQLLDLCRRLDVRIWHAHDYKSNLFGLTLRPFWNMKLITTVHGWVKQTTRTPLYYTIDRWCLPYYHHVIAVADDLYERMLALGVPAQRCTLLPNGIDERVFSRQCPPHAAPLRNQMQVPPGRLVVGGMGRLSAEKAFNNLIYATQKLLAEGLDIELWIAGEGDSQADLQKLIDHHQLGARVKLLGFRADTVGFYQALDLFVLSSLREGLPNVLLEAMATSVPVVSTKVAGIPRLIADGVNGLLCAPGDIDGLAAGMRAVLTDPARRANLAQVGRQTIERQFTFRQRMAKEKEIYDRVLGIKQGTAPGIVPAVETSGR